MLVGILLALVLATVFIVGSVSLVLWQLHRRNRVSPDHPSAAPLTWLVAPHAAARLHRRLHNTVLVARAASASSPSVADLSAQIEAQAIALDRLSVVAYRLRSQRNGALHELYSQADQLEALTARLATAAIEGERLRALPGQPQDPLAQIAERLDALEAARVDLASLERHAGLEP